MAGTDELRRLLGELQGALKQALPRMDGLYAEVQKLRDDVVRLIAKFEGMEGNHEKLAKEVSLLTDRVNKVVPVLNALDSGDKKVQKVIWKVIEYIAIAIVAVVVSRMSSSFNTNGKPPTTNSSVEGR